MLDSSQAQTNSESNSVVLARSPYATASWGGFLAGLFNWYILAKTILIYRSELWLSVTGSTFCGTCATFADNEVYVAAPMWIGLGFVLWLRVRSVAPVWGGFAKWPVRLAFLGWACVVLAGIGATLLSITPHFLHRM